MIKIKFTHCLIELTCKWERKQTKTNKKYKKQNQTKNKSKQQTQKSQQVRWKHQTSAKLINKWDRSNGLVVTSATQLETSSKESSVFTVGNILNNIGRRKHTAWTIKKINQVIVNNNNTNYNNNNSNNNYNEEDNSDNTWHGMTIMLIALNNYVRKIRANSIIASYPKPKLDKKKKEQQQIHDVQINA